MENQLKGTSMNTPKSIIILFVGVIVAILPYQVQSHGRLIEPPSRSSMWRYGFNTTANYNDHELYCGGFTRQYKKNGGKCGACGDPWDGPRANEAGGLYANGILVRKYRKNSIIRIKVELTANHKGYFEFRICPNNNPKKRVSIKCLEKHLLQQSNGEGPRYFPDEGSNKVFESRYLLPAEMTCNQCVLQWRYVAGNNWGPCDNGSQAIGCGPQEEFRACADVAIVDNRGHAASEEYEDEDYNVVDTGRIHDKPYDEVDDDSHGGSGMWPLFMSLTALLIAILFFASLIGWFYRQKLLKFTRNKMGQIQFPNIRNLFTPSAKSNNSTVDVNSGNGDSGEKSNEAFFHTPVRPPRGNKLHYPSSMTTVNHPTDPVPAQPMQVTINGLKL